MLQFHHLVLLLQWIHQLLQLFSLIDFRLDNFSACWLIFRHLFEDRCHDVQHTHRQGLSRCHHKSLQHNPLIVSSCNVFPILLCSTSLVIPYSFERHSTFVSIATVILWLRMVIFSATPDTKTMSWHTEKAFIQSRDWNDLTSSLSTDFWAFRAFTYSHVNPHTQ